MPHKDRLLFKYGDQMLDVRTIAELEGVSTVAIRSRVCRHGCADKPTGNREHGRGFPAKRVTYCGMTVTPAEAASLAGISREAMYKRIRLTGSAEAIEVVGISIIEIENAGLSIDDVQARLREAFNAMRSGQGNT